MIFEDFPDFLYDDEDEKFLREYIPAYSTFLVNDDFSIVEKEFKDLAKRGHVRSLAKYLRRVEPQNWDEKLKKMGLAIKNRPGVKTPQEWEVVVSMDYHQPIDHGDIKTVEQMRNAILNSAEDYYYADKLHASGKIEDDVCREKLNRCRQLLADFEKHPYMQAVKKAQEGYYSTFLEKNNPIDAVGFLEHCFEPENQYINIEDFKRYGDGTYYPKETIAKVLVDVYNGYNNGDYVPLQTVLGYGISKAFYGKKKKDNVNGAKTIFFLSTVDEGMLAEATEVDKEQQKDRER